MTERTITGVIQRLDQDFIQIAPFLGFWLTQEQYEHIRAHYQVGDTISIRSEGATGLVTAIEEKLHES